MLFYYLTEKLIDSHEHLFKDTKNHHLHLYIDVQNVCKALFLENIIRDSYAYIQENKHMDLSAFSSFINYILNTKIQLRKYKFKSIKFFFFLDKGNSVYHTSFYKKYKIDRRITKHLIDQKISDLYNSNLKLNWELCYRWLNKFHDVYFFYFKYLETDFLPYYLINNYYIENNDIYHIILSSDKDMMQTIDRDKIYQYLKTSKLNTLLTYKDIIFKYLDAHKNPKIHDNIIKNKWYEFCNALDIIFAFAGDMGDNVPGIKKVGPTTAFKMLDCFVRKLNLSVQDIRLKIMKKEKIEYYEHKSDIKKYVNLFNDNIDDLFIWYHLVSYRALVYWLETCSNSNNDPIGLLKKVPNYKLNKNIHNIYLDPIYNILNNTKKLKYNKGQFITALQHINGGVCFKNCNVNMKTIDFYFNLFGEL